MGFLSVKVKVVLISTGVLSIAMALKLTIPLLSHFVHSQAPSIWTFFLTCFTPPYLYILLNFIILTIAASSKFHHSPPHTPLLPTEDYAAAVLPPVIIPGAVHTDYNLYNGVVSDEYAYDAIVAPKTSPSNDTITNGSDEAVLTADHGPAAVVLPPVKISGVVRTDCDVYNGVVSGGCVYDAITNGSDAVRTSLQRKDSLDFAFPNENEKPLVSARFGHRKAVKASPEGGKKVALGVAKPKRQDTMESTWKTITEGRAMPLARHLKKSDTWDSQPRRNAAPLTEQNGGGDGGTPNRKVMKKSETFGGGEKSASPGSRGRMRKEPSLSQDELNRRVEAFINKFNAEMRLQRQESLRQYREMIGGGVR